MGTPALKLEGTWEEILAHGSELAGRRVRVTEVRTPRTTEEPSPPKSLALRDALRQVAASQRGRVCRPGADAVQLIREGRSGPMYGEDSGD